jgi:hypothetical protein
VLLRVLTGTNTTGILTKIGISLLGSICSRDMHCHNVLFQFLK